MNVIKSATGSESSEFERLLMDWDQKNMKEGDVVTAQVIRIERDFVVVDTGLKSETRLPVQEFYDEDGLLNLKEGDWVSVVLEGVDDGYGTVSVSRAKAKSLVAWSELDQACQMQSTLKAMVSGKIKGGLSVTIKGLKGFLPGSLMDLRPLREVDSLVGKEIEVKVTKINQFKNNIVVSRKAVLEEQSGIDRVKNLNSLIEGMVMNGVVKHLAGYGAFVDIGGVDGLIHLSDLSWKRIAHPSEVLSLGQEVVVKVLKVDREKNRISLGFKQLTDDPWVSASRRYPVGARVFGTVSNLADYGVFVQMEDGVEGLVHTSELNWLNKHLNPFKLYQIGDRVEVMILSMDEKKRRASLGIKQCQVNPWVTFEKEYQPKTVVRGVVKSVTDFGVFLVLPNQLEGLLKMTPEHLKEALSQGLCKGQEMEVIVMDIDLKKERITLGYPDRSVNKKEPTVLGLALNAARTH